MITEAADSPSCWSQAEVMTPDAILHKIACGRPRHRWGKHRNRHVVWSCPPRCICIRHSTAGEQP
jgi:hypothetical protein